MSQFNDPPGQREELTPGDEQTPSRMLGWALAYAARGFLVRPLHTARAGHCSCGKRECSASGKHPRLPKWPSRATTESQEIRAWWTRWPEANIGLLTGARSGVIVLDIDPRNDGDASLASLEARYGKLPETPRVRTGGGGLHVYFAAPASEVSSGHPGSGLDLQGDGGRCVVLPPSLHRSGAEYRWVEGLSLDSVSLAPLPPWLLRPVGAGRAGTASKTHRPIERLETRGAASTSPWPESALRAECDAVAHAPAGTRNAALNKAAFNLGQLVPHLLEEARVESSLLAAAATCGLIEDDGEPAVRATLRSVARTAGSPSSSMSPHVAAAASSDDSTRASSSRCGTSCPRLNAALFRAAFRVPAGAWATASHSARSADSGHGDVDAAPLVSSRSMGRCVLLAVPARPAPTGLRSHGGSGARDTESRDSPSTHLYSAPLRCSDGGSTTHRPPSP